MPITITGVRFSYCNLFQPKPPFNNPTGEPKYGCTILVPKSNTTAKAAIDQAIAQAIDAGVSTKWNGVRPPQPAICVHDGDGPRPSDGSTFGEECKGCWVFTASSKQAPFVVDAQVQPIIDPTQVYSVSANHTAAKLAVALKAEKLIHLVAAEQLLHTPESPDAPIPVLPLSQVPALIRNGTIPADMAGKVNFSVEAVRSGVHSTVILDGRIAHSILIELLSDAGVGTMLVQ